MDTIVRRKESAGQSGTKFNGQRERERERERESGWAERGRQQERIKEAESQENRRVRKVLVGCLGFMAYQPL